MAGRVNPETVIMQAVRKALQEDGWFVVRIHQQGIGCYPGLADLFCLKGGRSVWLEVKTPAGRQSDPQKRFEQDVRRFGGEYRLCRGTEDLAGMLAQRSLFGGMT